MLDFRDRYPLWLKTTGQRLSFLFWISKMRHYLYPHANMVTEIWLNLIWSTLSKKPKRMAKGASFQRNIKLSPPVRGDLIGLNHILYIQRQKKKKRVIWCHISIMCCTGFACATACAAPPASWPWWITCRANICHSGPYVLSSHQVSPLASSHSPTHLSFLQPPWWFHSSQKRKKKKKSLVVNLSQC